MSEEELRQYVHGDQKAGDPELWFCRRCDSFVPEVHFAQGHHKMQRLSEYEKYLDEKKRFAIKMKNSPGKWRRPTTPRNCLE
jgi:hypothetical protein